MKHSADDSSKGDWVRADFEAALPLYPGEDLTDDDRQLVERWIAAHPEDRAALDAAVKSRALLVEHSRLARSRAERHDYGSLWDNVRGELLSSSLLAPQSASSASLQAGEQTVLQGPGSEHDQKRRGRRVLSPQVLATAAAVTICAGLAGWSLRGTQGLGAPVSPSIASPSNGTGSDALANGSAAETVTPDRSEGIDLASSSPIDETGAVGGARRLRPAGPDALHLIDQVEVVPTYLIFPLDDPIRRSGAPAGSQLTGGQ